MSIKAKKVFIAVRETGDDQSLFFRLWKLMSGEMPLAQQDPDIYKGLEQTRREVERYQAQMHRQQAHVDEIKRLCHVPVR